MEQHLDVKVGEMQRSAMQSYVNQCVFMSCCIKQLQGGYRRLEVYWPTSTAVDVSCPFTQTCQWP